MADPSIPKLREPTEAMLAGRYRVEIPDGDGDGDDGGSLGACRSLTLSRLSGGAAPSAARAGCGSSQYRSGIPRRRRGVQKRSAEHPLHPGPPRSENASTVNARQAPRSALGNGRGWISERDAVE